MKFLAVNVGRDNPTKRVVPTPGAISFVGGFGDGNEPRPAQTNYYKRIEMPRMSVRHAIECLTNNCCGD